MTIVTAFQAAQDAGASSNPALLTIIGSLIGIYAARRAKGKTSFRELSTGGILIGACFGALLLGLFPLVAALKFQEDSSGYAFGYWVGMGLTGGLIVGGPAALIAGVARSRKRKDASNPQEPPSGNRPV